MSQRDKIQQRRKRCVNVFAQIVGLFMCLLACPALWDAGVMANQEYIHLIETTSWRQISGPEGEDQNFQFMVFNGAIGSFFFVFGCGLIFLGARERKRSQPIAIE